MKNFLIVYSKTEGLIRLDCFRKDQAEDALLRKASVELAAMANGLLSDGEFVIVQADSAASLMATHSRYFI